MQGYPHGGTKDTLRSFIRDTGSWRFERGNWSDRLGWAQRKNTVIRCHALPACGICLAEYERP